MKTKVVEEGTHLINLIKVQKSQHKNFNVKFLSLSIINDLVATKIRFVNHKKMLLKNYKSHYKLYNLNLEDTMVGCLKINKN
jgi:hypothetical protein